MWVSAYVTQEFSLIRYRVKHCEGGAEAYWLLLRHSLWPEDYGDIHFL